MSIIIDLIVIGIIALCIFMGYKRGLVGVAFKILSFIIAIIITMILFKPVSNFIINNTTMATTIQNAITQRIKIQDIESGEIKKEESNLPNVVVDYINEEATGKINETKNNMADELAKELTITAINIIVIVALFIISRILLIFAKTILESVAEIPIIKQFDKAGGTIYGFLKGMIIIYVILTIISFALPMLEKTALLEAINNTILTKILYNNNIILKIFF